MPYGLSKKSWLDEGKAHLKKGEYNEAKQAFDKAIELDPKSKPAWYQMIKLLSEQGKYNEAYQALDKAIQLDPKNEKMLIFWAKIPWYGDDRKMSYVASYDSVEKATAEANAAAQYGWMPQGTSTTDGHSDLGTIGRSVFLLGGLGLLTAGSRSKGKVTITYVRTQEWLRTKNLDANMSTQNTQLSNQNDVIVLIERLAKLKEQGALTEEEFQAQKKKILCT